MLSGWVLAADTCKQVQMGWRWGTKQSNKNKKRGAEGKEEGGEEAQTDRLVR